MSRYFSSIGVISALFLSACGTSAGSQHTQSEMHMKMKSQAPAQAIHTVHSRYGFSDTVARLEKAIQSRGMTIFAVIDHQDAARKNGLDMQAAKVIVFGVPKVGTPLMRKDPAFALQLPLRVLVTEINGKIEVLFTDTRALISGSKISYSEVENTLANAEKLIHSVVSE